MTKRFIGYAEMTEKLGVSRTQIQRWVSLRKSAKALAARQPQDEPDGVVGTRGRGRHGGAGQSQHAPRIGARGSSGNTRRASRSLLLSGPCAVPRWC